MSESAVAPATLPVGRTPGGLSFWLWAAAFVIGGAVAAVFLSIPKDAPSGVHTLGTVVFLVVCFLLAPIAHVIGLVFGLISAFRPGRGRGLGIAGLILNGATVAGAAFLTWAVLSIGTAWR